MSLYPKPTGNSSNVFNELDYGNSTSNSEDIDLNNFKFDTLRFSNNSVQTSAFTSQDKATINDLENDVMYNTIKLTNFDYVNNYSQIDKIKTNELQILGQNCLPYTNTDQTQIYQNQGNIISHNDRITVLENSNNSTDLTELNNKTQNISTETTTNSTKIIGDVELKNTFYKNDVSNTTVGQIGSLDTNNDLMYVSGNDGLNIRAFAGSMDLIASNINLNGTTTITDNLNINGSGLTVLNGESRFIGYLGKLYIQNNTEIIFDTLFNGAPPNVRITPNSGVIDCADIVSSATSLNNLNSRVSTNETNVLNNTTDIATNTTNITNNATDISNNTTQINSNTSRITILENNTINTIPKLHSQDNINWHSVHVNGTVWNYSTSYIGTREYNLANNAHLYNDYFDNNGQWQKGTRKMRISYQASFTLQDCQIATLLSRVRVNTSSSILRDESLPMGIKNKNWESNYDKITYQGSIVVDVNDGDYIYIVSDYNVQTATSASPAFNCIFIVYYEEITTDSVTSSIQIYNNTQAITENTNDIETNRVAIENINTSLGILPPKIYVINLDSLQLLGANNLPNGISVANTTIFNIGQYLYNAYGETNDWYSDGRFRNYSNWEMSFTGLFKNYSSHITTLLSGFKALHYTTSVEDDSTINNVAGGLECSNASGTAMHYTYRYTTGPVIVQSTPDLYGSHTLNLQTDYDVLTSHTIENSVTRNVSMSGVLIMKKL